MPETSLQNSAELFDARVFCPLCGSAELSHGANVQACARCGHRDFNNPVTAVVVFVLDAGDRVLLIRRARNPAAGKWAPPGGFLDADETLEEAAARETAEETGLAVRDLRYLCSAPNDYVYRGLSRPVCDVCFTARMKSFEVELQRAEAASYRWFPLAEIDPAELAFDSMRRGLAILRQTEAGHPS